MWGRSNFKISRTLTLWKNEAEADCLKNSTFYRKHLQTKLTTSNNMVTFFCLFFWKQHEASQICPTHHFTKIQDRPTSSLILPLGLNLMEIVKIIHNNYIKCHILKRWSSQSYLPNKCLVLEHTERILFFFQLSQLNLIISVQTKVIDLKTILCSSAQSELSNKHMTRLYQL